MNTRLMPMFLRLIAAIAVIVEIVLFAVQLKDARLADAATNWPLLIFQAVVCFALAIILLGVAETISNADYLPDEMSRAVSRLQLNMSDLQKRLDDMTLGVDRISRQRAAPPPAPAAPQNVLNRPLMVQLPDNLLDPVLHAVQEIRELSLLNEAERRERLTRMEQDRKRMLIRQMIEHIEQLRWADANAVVETLEREHANDAEVRRTRAHLEDARRNAETPAVNKVRDSVDNYIAIGAWDQAHHAANKLAQDFPTSSEAQRILARVVRERDIHTETSVARMVEEIRHDIDRRMWRRALMHAQRLIERFAEHPKTHRIIEQLNTLQENAEIEERQELEVRIQELIRGGEFNEAIALAEELLQRFPNSPQGEAIEQLLPRIRQLAAEDQMQIDQGVWAETPPGEEAPPQPQAPQQST